MDSYTNHRLRPRRFRRMVVNIFLISLLIIFFGFLSYLIINSKINQSPLLKPIKDLSAFIKPPKKDTLENIVKQSLEGARGTYSIYIKNLKTDETYGLDEHKIYPAGSLYKLWIAGEVYQQIQAGNIQEDDILSEDINTLNNEFNIDPALAEMTDGTITLTVQQALNQMITISHNYSALILSEKVKLSSVASFLSENGFNESKIGTDYDSPLSTPFDISLFFEKLYKNELLNEQYTKEMIDLLKKQQLNDKLPKLLPQNTEIAHKTGEIDFNSHDAGIVYTPNGDYIITVLSESNYPAGAEERIAMISKAVYDYFTKQKS